MGTEKIDFAAIPMTAIKVLTNPAGFFREMPKAGGFIEPLVFMVVMGVIGGIIQAVLSIIGLNPMAGMATGIAAIIIVPIAVAIFGFIGAAILFVIWKLLGSNESYETAYRCAAYIAAITPIQAAVNLMPIAGPIVSLGLTTWLLVVASKEVHEIPEQKAWMVFGIIAVILTFLSISGQMAARKFKKEGVKIQKEMQDAAREMEKQTDDMKKQAEKNAADATQKSPEEMQNQADMIKKQAEEMQKAMEQMQKQGQKQ